MDQSKNKFGRYFSEVFKKTGVFAPALGAALIFAALFIVRFIGLFGLMKASNAVGYYFLLIFSIIGIVLLAVYLILKIKSAELVSQDSFLLTLDFLMIYLLLGTIVVDFVVLDFILYAVALVITVVFNVLRIMFFNPRMLIVNKPAGAANTTLKKYFDIVFDKYGIWNFICAAIGGFALIGVILYVLDIKHLFVSQTAITVGTCLTVLIFGIVFVLCYIRRVIDKRVAFIDAFLLFTLFTMVLCGLFLIGNYSVLNLAIWIVAMLLSFGLTYILALSTHNESEETSDDFFMTDGGKKFAKNPKVYFKKLIKNFNIILLCALAAFTFAIFDACITLNVLGFFGGTKYMLSAVLILLFYFFAGLIYLGVGYKKPVMLKKDGLLFILDVALLLSVFPIFLNLHAEGMITSIIIWAMAFVVTIAFTITRMFKVKDDKPINVAPVEPKQNDVSEN